MTTPVTTLDPRYGTGERSISTPAQPSRRPSICGPTRAWCWQPAAITGTEGWMSSLRARPPGWPTMTCSGS